MKNLDVLVMASSRPQLLPYTIESFEKFVASVCNLNIRYLLHEDCVFPDFSEKVMHWAKNSKKFNVIERHKPKIGLGPAMDFMFKERIKSEYMFYLQDDWEFERTGIDLDRILWTMDRHKNINLILFNKYKNMGSYAKFPSELHVFDGLKLKLYNGWSFIPGVWRMSKAMQHWKTRKERPECFFTSQFGKPQDRTNPKWVKDNMGIYFYGGDGEPRFVRHLGNSFRVADWQLEGGRPGGSLNYECREVETGGYYRAPWLPEIEARPTYIGSGEWGNDVSPKTIEKLKKVGIGKVK
ncbi:MAG: hypothetical protein ACOC56_00130 [Atribacterota bacterium]